MSIHKRPFAGTWTKTVQNKEIRRLVPDMIVKFNGETSYPSCAGCSGNIDLQDLITSVTVSNSTDTSPANVSISMSIPTNRYACLFRDNKFVLHPGIEVHIYMRGFFSTQELVKAQGDTSESDIPMKPYYQVFHGVVTETSFSFGGGFYECSMSAADLFHFWQYQNINTNPSALGSKVSGDRTRMNFVGGKHVRQNAYSVIFDLYSSKHGDAGAQDFVLGDFTNIGIKSDLYQDSFWDVTGWYWAKRFQQPMSKLKMYGADGRQFTTLEQLAVADPALVKDEGLAKNASSWLSLGEGKGDSKFRISKLLGVLRAANPNYAFPTSSLFYVQQSAFALYKDGSYQGDQGLGGDNIAAQTAFAQELSSMGQVNIFEAQVTTKMDIASTVCTESGFEFYIDMNGDYVFKPPLYNLDTSDSRVYTIKAIDIISFDNTESEPTATVMKGTGGYFANWGSLLGSEYENRGMYVDWKLVAKYGWREADFSTTFFTDPKSIYYACINRLYLENKEVQSGSVSIPLRPEMKLGFPVYIEPFDCFYYVNSISHSFSFGGECTTDLGLIAKRAKFFPPMVVKDDQIPTLNDIDLENIYRASRPLYTRNNEGLPKLMGLPNVVMALDVHLLNPLWVASGEITAEVMGSALNLKGSSAGGNKNQEQTRVFLQALAEEGLISLGQSSTDGFTDTVFFYDQSGIPSESLTFSQVEEIFAILFVATERARETTSSWNRGETSSYMQLYKDSPELFSNNLSGSNMVDQDLFYKDEEHIRDDLQVVQAKFNQRNNFLGKSVFTLFLATLDRYRETKLNTPFGKDRTPIQNYLSAMSFMKSSFRPDDMQPGAYRYYTDAIPKTHPNYAMFQGQSQVYESRVYIDGKIEVTNTLLAPQKLKTPLATTKVLPNGDGTLRISVPNRDPKTNGNDPIYLTEYGIKVLVPRGTTDADKFPPIEGSSEYYKAIPTSQIRTIMFAIPRAGRGQHFLKYEFKSLSILATAESRWDKFREIFWGRDLTCFQHGGLEFKGVVERTKIFLTKIVQVFGEYIPEKEQGTWQQELDGILAKTYTGAYATRRGRFEPDYTGETTNTPIPIVQVPFDAGYLLDGGFSDIESIAIGERIIMATFDQMLDFIKTKFEFVSKAIDKEMLDGFKTDLRTRLVDPNVSFEDIQEDFRATRKALVTSMYDFWISYFQTANFSSIFGYGKDESYDKAAKSILYNYDNSSVDMAIPQKQEIENLDNAGEWYYSPVLPVSDNKGFEHFGTYAYGRDFNLRSFSQVLATTPDYWANLNPEQMFDFVYALAEAQDPETAISDIFLANSNISQEAQVSGNTRLGLAEVLAQSITDNPSTVATMDGGIPQELKEALDNGTLTGEKILTYAKSSPTQEGQVAAMFQLQFANDILKLTTEYGSDYGVSTENVPISLAQLDKEYAPFQCSGAAGSVALDKSYGFQVTNQVLSSDLNIADYVKGESTLQLQDWRLRQEALRGNPVPDGSSGVTLQNGWEALSDFGSLFGGADVEGSILEQGSVLGEDIGNAIQEGIEQFNAIGAEEDEEDN